MTPRLILEADQCASDVVAAYGSLGWLSVMVRQEGSEARIICPKGCERELAMMLYKAADAMADQVPSKHSVKR